MKKTKVIALVLCAAVMLMGAGYAYWSDTLVINNTVSTGEMDVIFTHAAATTADELVTATAPTVNPQADVKQIDYTVTNLYPGATVNYEATIFNDGTIPAVVKGIVISDSFTGNMTAADLDYILVSGKVAGYTVPQMTWARFKALVANQTYKLAPDASIVIDVDLHVAEGTPTANIHELGTMTSNMTINFGQHNQ